MSDSQNKQPNECKCLGEKKAKDFEKKISEIKTEIAELRYELQIIRKALTR